MATAAVLGRVGFRRRGLPFWASIHAPTAANDSRNHHAHVVLADRPMRRMPHPDTGAMAWDLTIRDDYRTATRHTRVRYPHRQKRDPEMRDRRYVRASRERFAAVVNEVMAGSASGVRCDPRSYKDMGLDVAPMRNVARILADKLGRRSFVVMDADWTRKMIDTEMQAAAARRDRTFLDLQEADRRMQDTARQAQRSAAANARLPTHLRLTPGRVIARKASEAVMTKLLDLRRDRLAARFADETTLQALQHVAAATAPQPGRGRPGRVHDTATAPDPADLAALHEAATEEIVHLARALRAKQAGMARREAELARSWREGPQAPAASGLVGLQPRRIADAGRSPVSAPPVKAAPLRWNQWLSPMSARAPPDRRWFGMPGRRSSLCSSTTGAKWSGLGAAPGCLGNLNDKPSAPCYASCCATSGGGMVEVSSAEVQRNFGAYREIAEGTRTDPEAVTVLHYNRPSVVIVSAEEYARLKRRDKRVVLTEDLPEWLAQQVASSEMDPQFAHLDAPA